MAEDITENYSSYDNWIGIKTFLFILSIPFLMVLGKFLIVWDINEFLLSTFTCVCIIATICLGGKKDESK